MSLATTATTEPPMIGHGDTIEHFLTGQKGRQVLSWDAKDNNGQSVASGIYFYRLNTPEGSKVQKMMVVR